MRNQAFPYISHTWTRPIRPNNRLLRRTLTSQGRSFRFCRKTVLVYTFLQRHRNITAVRKPIRTWNTCLIHSVSGSWIYSAVTRTHHSCLHPSRLHSRQSRHIPRTWVYSVRFYTSSETLRTLSTDTHTRQQCVGISAHCLSPEVESCTFGANQSSSSSRRNNQI